MEWKEEFKKQVQALHLYQVFDMMVFDFPYSDCFGEKDLWKFDYLFHFIRNAIEDLQKEGIRLRKDLDIAADICIESAKERL